MATKPLGPPLEKHPPLKGIAPGDLLCGRYEVLRLVGEGGVGVVYAGRDRVLDRPVAIKVLLGQWALVPGFEEAFEREARGASRISNPHCVMVLDFGRTEHFAFLVFEWLEGRTLADVVAAEGALPPERALRLVLQLCDALTAVHTAGMVHRDVKPENVIVTSGPTGAEVAKLIDFGVARLVGAAPGKLTQVGLRFGSAPYMSPEQVMGGTCDARSDVYAAAAVLYFLLTARWPYEGEDAAILRDQVSAPPPSLCGKLQPWARLEALDRVVTGAMAKNPEHRPQSAAALAKTLRALMEPSRPQLWRRLGLGGAAVALTLVIGAGWLSRSPPAPARTNPDPLTQTQASEAALSSFRRQGKLVRLTSIEQDVDGYLVTLTVDGTRGLVVYVDAMTGEVTPRKAR